ncbi:putative translation initiation factor, aIF-2BI family protein [Plesiocystis pacifica SIR-1]|uniref:Methylthioribose-1-phosphate isomerase n=1 Tax=Plesiocystis pacifica SIR-1 TaxID=391625 RepID=A6GF55_9BACT|nr:S-methyl-5-thioribose-1-phosphate isomerase [Plesiocystis pacifica]EDM75514.1 putative translation initiation factor, aIF-2BI family protein [Plesiocystis pacifica SIR-1]
MNAISTDPSTYQGLRPVQLSADGRALRLLDQTRLPIEEVWVELRELEPIAHAIETLTVRGAPAIGCAAAYGLYVLSLAFPDDPEAFQAAFDAAAVRLANTRPTAVNLFVAIEQQRGALAKARAQQPAVDGAGLRQALREEATRHVEDDLRFCLEMGAHGASCLPAGGILTHCNTGALATSGHGTALGVIRSAHASGTELHVFVDETRPLLQGSRLTAWELMHDGIPCSLLCDNMAGALMARGEIQAAIVGADRITANGDAANKIGTYTVAVLCKHHGIPFYVAAPWTTIDMSLASGAAIPIEERKPEEVRRHGGNLRAPADVPVRNPAFDVTPAELITGIITERGVFAPGELAAQAQG